jgi:hypothetical protein
VAAATAPQLDRQQIETAIARLRTEQHLAAAIVAGLAASLVGASPNGT